MDEIEAFRVEMEQLGYESLLELFWNEYDIDDTRQKKWPDMDITVDIEKGRRDRWQSKKMKIEKPAKVKHYKLKKKES